MHGCSASAPQGSGAIRLRDVMAAIEPAQHTVGDGAAAPEPVDAGEQPSSFSDPWDGITDADLVAAPNPNAQLTVDEAPSAATISAADLRAALVTAMRNKDLAAVSTGEIRAEIACTFGLADGALDCRKREIRKLTATVVDELSHERGEALGVQPFLQQVLDMKGERDGARQEIYFVTISRVLETISPVGVLEFQDISKMTREDVAKAIRDAFDNPLPSGARGGRPRSSEDSAVALVIVFQEQHADGSVHYHVVVKLLRQQRFISAKRTLRERHGLPSHFSCTHSQLWSAVRYGYVGTPKKPEVDEEPYYWTHDGAEVDLFELSQRPFHADHWRKRREAKDKEACKENRKATFNKMDLTALIVSKHLYSKDTLMAYVQNHGTEVMQVYVNRVQRKLSELIEDAAEWEGARESAAIEQTTDWALVCQAAEAACPHGGECTYKQAADEIFHRNSTTVSWMDLAAALRDIIVMGPSKTTRVPFLVGPSNSGKSTLVYPFDDIFGPKRVLHKPALGSTFGLRNIVKKRLIFWDDYRPVEYAQEKTVPISLFLTLFIGQHSEIQISQSFNDGNLDVKWKRGVVFTGKHEGLWIPTKNVTEEDIKHTRNRVQEFLFHATMPQGGW